MINQLLIYINLLGIILFSWLIDQEITLKMDAPAEVYAGQSFQIDLSIDKGDLQSFSRFIQDLPYGLSAERISTANADFSFEDQHLRLIWIKLPADNQLEISYKIHVDKRLTGSFDLKGEFAYIIDNQRKSIIVNAASSINIIPDPTLAKNLLIDINDSERLKKEFGPDAIDPNKLVVTRSIPEKTGNHRYTINLKFKKGDLSKFAKIEETIPTGFRATEENSENGIFSFSQGIMKILWMNLPNSPEFIISYNIIPEPGMDINTLQVKGRFSYIIGNSTKTIMVENEKLLPTIATIEENIVTKEIIEDEKSDSIPEIKTQQKLIEQAPLVDNHKKYKETEKLKKQEMLQPEKGIYYRIQLAAGHQKINTEKYFKRLKIDETVKIEYHQGWRKYSTGSYSIYKNARDQRIKIWETTSIKDAFVAAYDNGRRITVQEALMVTNQPWYR